MDAAGIVPEEDLQEAQEAEAQPGGEMDIEESDERLSVFQDFLEGLDISDEEGDEGDNENDEDEED
jgi:hypothetical protein